MSTNTSTAPVEEERSGRYGERTADSMNPNAWTPGSASPPLERWPADGCVSEQMHAGTQSSVWSLQVCRHAPQEKPGVWESVVMSATWAGKSFKMETGIWRKRAKRKMCVSFLTASRTRPRSSSENHGTHCNAPASAKWRFPYVLRWRKAQL